MRIPVRFLKYALSLSLVLVASVAGASTLTVLKSLYSLDGSYPKGGLVFDAAGNLYGTTSLGGGPTRGAAGSVFMLTPSDTGAWGEKALYVFQPNTTDGELPHFSPILDGSGNVYGITVEGGQYGGGTLFKLTPDGLGLWSESLEYEFSGPDGSFPNAVFRDSAGNFFGTTMIGGIHGWTVDRGIAYELSPKLGGGYSQQVLHYFTTAGNDGVGPGSNLVQDAAGNFYGTTKFGGLYDYGTVFQIAKSKLGGWHEEIIYNFNGDDGWEPLGNIAIDSQGNVFGTTVYGGSQSSYLGYGTVFEVSPNGDGTWSEKTIHTFSYKNNDGQQPMGGVTLDAAGNLWGTTYGGGASGLGIIFEFSPQADGSWTGKVLHNFSGTDGADPDGALILDSAGNVYGTTVGGGFGSNGVVFKLAP